MANDLKITSTGGISALGGLSGQRVEACNISSGGILSGGRDLADIFAVSSGSVDGSGTANYIPSWSDSNTLTDSLLSGGSAVTRTTGTLSAGCLIGPAVCGTTQVQSPLVCSTNCICGPQVCGTTKVQGVAVCGTTSVCGAAVCGTTSVCGPAVCGSTSVCSPAVCGTTSVCGPQVCGTTKVEGVAVCGTTSVCGAAICGTTSVCSPQVCGSTKVQGPAVCGTTSVCGAAVCGTTSVCGAAVCGTTSVCGGIVAGTSLSATSTNSGIVSAGRDLADVFTGGCCLGTTTASNSQTFTNKGGNISQWTNDSGYTDCVGDITAVVAGTLLDGGATSGSATLNVDLSELATSTSDGDGDYFVVTDASDAQKKLTKGSINNSGFNNDAGYTDCVGDITAVVAGTALDGGATSGSATLNVDLSELSTSTSDGDGDYFVVTDTSSGQSKLTKGNINNSGFNNDSGFTDCMGTVTSVGTGDGLDGGAITGSGTLTVDSTVVRTTGAQTIAGNKCFTGSTTMTGNLSVRGTVTCIDTRIETTSAVEIHNSGTGPALCVNQTGAQPVADFQDDSTTAFYIANGGNVGIGTDNPNEELTVAGTLSACTAVCGAAVCGTASVCSPAVCGTTSVCSPQVCGTTKVQGVAVCGTTSVCSPQVCGTTKVQGVAVCGTTSVCGAAVCGTTSVCGPAVCGSTSVCSPAVCGTTSVCGPAVCGTTSVCSPQVCGSTKVQGVAVCGTTSVCGAAVCGTTSVRSPAVCGSTSVCGAAVCGTTSVCGGIVAGTSLSATSTNSGIVSAGRDLADVFTGGCCTGTTTASNTQTFTNKSGNISQWTNDCGYTTCTGDITAVVAGTLLDGGATSGSATLNVDLSELSTSTSDGDGDYFVVTDASDAQRKLTKGNINNSGFNNDAGYTDCVGDVTGIDAGTLIDIDDGTTATPTVNVDLSELTDMTAGFAASDEFVVLDSSAQRRKAASEIGNSVFNNDSGWTDCTGTTTASNSQTFTNKGGNISQWTNDSGYTDCVGDITAVVAGTLLDGGATSGSATLNVDLSELATSTSDADGDYFVVTDASDAQKKLTKGNIANSGFNNDSGFTDCEGTVTSVAGGDGMSGTVTSSGSLAVDSTVVRTTGGQVIAGSKCFSRGITTSDGLSASSTTNGFVSAGRDLADIFAVSSGSVDGSGTANFLPLWSDSNTLADSLLSGGTDVTRTTGTLSAGCLIGPAVCGTTSVCGPAVCGTTSVCSPQVCGSTKVQGVAVCGTTSVCGAAVCGTTSVCGPAVCGSTSVCSPQVCGTTKVQGVAVCGTTSVCSPQVCGTTKVQGPAVCGTTSVCGAAVCGTTSVCGGIVAGTSLSATSTNSGIVSAGRDLADVFTGGCCLGTTTASNSQTFTNKAGAISQWTNDSGYTDCVGDITAVVAGTALDGGATSGSATLNLDLSELATSTSDGDGDYFVVTDTSSGQSKLTKGNINNSGFNNDAGYTDCTGTTTASNSQTFTNKGGNISQWTNDSGYTDCVGDITAVVAGTLLDGGATSGSATLNVDLSELTDMTETFVGADEIVVLDGATAQKRKAASEIGNSVFNNDSGWTDCTGTTTASNSQTFTNKAGNISQWTNDSGFTDCTGTTTASNSQTFTNKGGNISQWTNDSGFGTGDITAVVAGTLLDGGATSGSATLNVDLSELSTSTSDGDGDYFVVTDASDAQRKLTKGNINNSGFNNDSGFTDCAGTVTSVAGGDGMSGTVTSSGSLAVDSTVIRTTGTQTIGGSKTFSSAICTDCVRATDGDGLKLYDDGGNGIFVEDGGNVGIGSTNPANLLDVCSGNLNINNGGYCLKFGGASSCSSMFFYGDMYWCNETGDVRIDQAAENKDIIFKTCDGSMKETMRIDGSSQQVGIGTTAPNELLTVKGSISASGALQGQLDINAQTGTTYTLVIGDKGKLITLSNGSAITLTIPPNSDVAFPIGTEITVTQLGAGQLTIAEGSGVTASAADDELKTRVQYSAAVLTKIASDTWLVAGDLTA